MIHPTAKVCEQLNTILQLLTSNTDPIPSISKYSWHNMKY